MILHTLTLGLYQSHCYLLEEGGHVLIIDPGARGDTIQTELDRLGPIQVDGIVLTHGHVDHISAASELQELYACPLYAHPLEEDVIYLKRLVPRAYRKPFTGQISPLEEGGYDLGPFHFEAYHMPGHSPGHVVIAYQDCLFTGDLLFKGKVGLTDTYKGNPQALAHSLQRLLRLDPETKVYPGHGPSTSLAQEREQMNQYIRVYGY